MARDGTLRAGARQNRGGGGKKADVPKLDVVKSVTKQHKTDKNYPKCDPFLNEKQSETVPLNAKKIYDALADWLEERGHTGVQPKLVEEYALSYARWRQAEKLVSKNGLLAPHPTTGADIASPLVSVANMYYKQMHTAWYAIWDVIRQSGEQPAEKDEMEQLLESIG